MSNARKPRRRPNSPIDLFTAVPEGWADRFLSPASWPAYHAALTSPDAETTLRLCVPTKQLKEHALVVAAAPVGNARYLLRGGDTDRALRATYSITRVHSGIGRLRVEMGAGDDALYASADAVGRAARGSYEYVARYSDRLEAHQHAHHIADFAGTVAGLCHTVSSSWNDCYGRWMDEQTMNDWHGAPRTRLLGLVNAVVGRWLPAVQNVISHLPAADRLEAAREEQDHLHAFLTVIARLHAVADAGLETERWQQFGYGALDEACIVATALVGRVQKLAARVVIDGRDEVDVQDAREQQGRAKASMLVCLSALDQLANERFAMLRARVWEHHKSDMVAFAKFPGGGGISPEVEVLYHTRGSAFLGC